VEIFHFRQNVRALGAPALRKNQAIGGKEIQEGAATYGQNVAKRVVHAPRTRQQPHHSQVPAHGKRAISDLESQEAFPSARIITT
jgi:hypothetical protein